MFADQEKAYDKVPSEEMLHCMIKSEVAEKYVGIVQYMSEDISTAVRCAVGGAVAEWVRALACTGVRTVRDGFESHCGQLRFGTLAIPFTPPCQCLSEETLKAVGPFYLVSMPGEVKDPTSPHWNV